MMPHPFYSPVFWIPRSVFGLSVLCVLLPSTVCAAHDVQLRAVLHTASASTFRVISRRAGVTRDVTADGLRVGVAPDGEERIAFCRPVFLDDVAPFVDYKVASAATEENPIAAGYYVPTGQWSAATPPDVLYAMKDQGPQAATPGYLNQMFGSLLKSGNNPTSGLGLLLTGTRDFRTVPNAEIYLIVRLSIPLTVRILNLVPQCPDLSSRLPLPMPQVVPPPPPAAIPWLPAAIPNSVLVWSSSCSGVATLTVNGQLLSTQGIRVTGLRKTQTLLPSTALVPGRNLIAVTMYEDDASLGQAPTTTSVTISIGTLRQNLGAASLTVNLNSVTIAGGTFDTAGVSPGDVLQLRDVNTIGFVPGVPPLRRFRIKQVVSSTQVLVESLIPEGYVTYIAQTTAGPRLYPYLPQALTSGTHQEVAIFAPICPFDPLPGMPYTQPPLQYTPLYPSFPAAPGRRMR